MVTGHGLTVEQVSDARLVEWMCQMRPGLSPAAADVALQALRSLHMVVHRDSEVCGPVADPRAGLCPEGTSGDHGRWLCAQQAGHQDDWHKDGRGNRWRTVGNLPAPHTA